MDSRGSKKELDFVWVSSLILFGQTIHLCVLIWWKAFFSPPLSLSLSLSLSSGCLCSNFGLPATHICWLLIIRIPFPHTLFSNSALYFSLHKIVHSDVVIIAISPFTLPWVCFRGDKVLHFSDLKNMISTHEKDLCEKNGPNFPDYWF